MMLECFSKQRGLRCTLLIFSTLTKRTWGPLLGKHSATQRPVILNTNTFATDFNV